MSEPAARYRAERERWLDQLAIEERQSSRLSAGRLIIFVAGLVTIGFIVINATSGVSPAWALAPFTLFLALVAWHARVDRRRDSARRSVEYVDRGLARLEHRWMSGGDDGARFKNDRHIYASDLELFGPGSLFQLLSTCRTETGAARLADWLGQAAAPEEIVARHDAVREIATKPDLRRDLAVVGPDVTAGLDSGRLRAWATSAPIDFPGWMVWLAPAVAAVNVATLVGAGIGWWPGIVPVLALGASSAAASVVQRATRQVLRSVAAPATHLVLLATLLDRVVTEQFTSAWMTRLMERWRRTGATPGDEVRRLARLVDLSDSRRNFMFAPVAAVLVLGTQLAMGIERWRQRVGPSLIDWLDGVGDLEAIVALGTFAFEHPTDVFPRVDAESRRFVATGLAHPLLPESTTVRNDVTMEPPLQLMLVSGSNMSGKSTLLKAVGVNLVLAQAGAPVRARSLTTAPFAVGASLVLRESLLEGRSRFYAEIVRLREIVALTDDLRPVLFLLDELLAGTNSHDRAIGAEGLLRGLVDRGAMGFVTTHDLALTAIAERLSGRATNWHFEDRLEGGKLEFDYRLKPGVVARSNALELMRSVGLSL